MHFRKYIIHIERKICVYAGIWTSYLRFYALVFYYWTTETQIPTQNQSFLSYFSQRLSEYIARIHDSKENNPNKWVFSRVYFSVGFELASFWETTAVVLGYVVASYPASGLDPRSLVSFLVEVFPEFFLNCKTVFRKFRLHLSPDIIWPSQS